MRESDVGTERDPPRDYVVSMRGLTVAEAREAGKVLGSHGFTGVFLSGTVAENLGRYAEWVKQTKARGGDVDA